MALRGLSLFPLPWYSHWSGSICQLFSAYSNSLPPGLGVCFFHSPPPVNNCWEVELPFERASEIQLPPGQHSTLGVLVTTLILIEDVQQRGSHLVQPLSALPLWVQHQEPASMLIHGMTLNISFLPTNEARGENHINHQDGVILWDCNSCTKVYYQETGHGHFSAHEWTPGPEAPTVASEVWSESALSQLRVCKRMWAAAHKFP